MLQRSKVLAIDFGVSIGMIFLTQRFITDRDLKSMATWWIVLVPISARIFGKKKVVGAKA